MRIFVYKEIISSHYQPMKYILGHFQPKVMTRIWNIIEKVHFLVMFAKFGQNGNFPQKSGSTTFLPLWTSNFKVSEKISNSSPVITTESLKKGVWALIGKIGKCSKKHPSTLNLPAKYRGKQSSISRYIENWIWTNQNTESLKKGVWALIGKIWNVVRSTQVRSTYLPNI